MYNKKVRGRVGSKGRLGRSGVSGALLAAGRLAYSSFGHRTGTKRKMNTAFGSTQRKKYKGGLSLTRTKTKTKENAESYAQHHGLEKKGVRVIMHRFASCRPSQGRWKYVDQMSGEILSAVGRQGVNDIGYFVLPQNFVSASKTFAALGRSLVKQDVGSGFFGMNPYQKTTGGAQTNNTAVGEGQDERLVLEKVEVKYTFVNSTTSPVELDLYVVTPRSTVLYSISPSTNWATVLTGEGLGTNPASNQATAFGYITNTLVGQKPGQNAAFNKMYKMKAERRFILQPGSNIDWTLSLHYNKVFDRTNMGQTATAGGAHPGMSVAVFAVTRGSLYKDIGGSNDYTYCSSEVGVVATAEYFLKMPKGLINKQQTTLGYPALQATATGVLYAVDDKDTVAAFNAL